MYVHSQRRDFEKVLKRDKHRVLLERAIFGVIRRVR